MRFYAPGRAYDPVNLTYGFGFNGKFKMGRIYGEDNAYDYGMRIYDPRAGKFLSVDPLTRSYPYFTPYQFAGNTPIWTIDVDGGEPLVYTNSLDFQKSKHSRWGYDVYTTTDLNNGSQVILMNRPNSNDWYYLKNQTDGKYAPFFTDAAGSNIANAVFWQRFKTGETLRMEKLGEDMRTIQGMFAGAIVAVPSAAFAAAGGALAWASVEEGAAATATNVALSIYRNLPQIGAFGRLAAEFLDESGSMQGANSGITFRATEVLVNSFSHIFSSKHVKSGLEMFGNGESEILKKIESIIVNNINNLKEGDNFIETTINGAKGTVKAFVKDKNIISVNAVKGDYKRQYNNVITDINSE